MTSYLWPSSPLATITILVSLHCLPAGYLGLLCKFFIIFYLLTMFIGYLFSSKKASRRSPLVPNRTSYALVTGASAGIGAHICRDLVRRGFNVVMVARSKAKLDVLADEFKQINDQVNIHVVTQDLNASDAVESLIRKIDALKDVNIDMIVNNAGLGSTKPFIQTELTDPVFDQMIALHVRVPTFLIRHYLPKMLTRPSRIVNVSSEISYMSSPRAVVYASTKAFLTQFTTSLAYEIEQINDNHNLSLLLATPGPTQNTEFDGHNQSVIFRLPFVNLTAEQVAQQIVDASLRGDCICTPGWFNQFTIWLMTKVPLSFAHLVCWLLWASWPEVKQWLHERRHLVIVCFNLIFFLLILACFVLVKITRQLYYRFF